MNKTKTAKVPAKAKVSVPAPATTETVTTAESAAPGRLQLRDVVSGLPDVFQAPTWLNPMADAVRVIATMPTKTRDQRAAARDAYVAAMVAATGNTSEPMGKHTGRFTGMAVFETQNAIYLACVLANVAVDEGHVCAMWRGELPHAKCDYLGTAYDRAYPWSTLSMYTNGHHNGGPIPGAREAVTVWAKRGRKPL